MFWALQGWWPDALALDLIYFGGVLTLCVAAIGRRSSALRIAKTLGLGWLLIVLAFIWRFAFVLSGDWYGQESVKLIALTRCVLHTLAVPTALTSGLVLWFALGNRSIGHPCGVWFVLWTGAAAVPLLVCAWLVYEYLLPNAVYVGPSPFP
jgi:hypothetical protein